MSELLVIKNEYYYNLMTQPEVDAHPQKAQIERLRSEGREYADIETLKPNGYYEIPSLGLGIGTGKGWNRDKFILIRTVAVVPEARLDPIVDANDKVLKNRQYGIDLSTLTINTTEVNINGTNVMESTVSVATLTALNYIDKAG